MSVALVTHRAKRMRRTILSSVACQALPHFSTLSKKRHDYGENVIEHKIYVVIFSTILFEIFLIQRRIQRDTIINVHLSSGKVHVMLVRF